MSGESVTTLRFHFWRITRGQRTGRCRVIGRRSAANQTPDERRVSRLSVTTVVIEFGARALLPEDRSKSGHRRNEHLLCLSLSAIRAQVGGRRSNLLLSHPNVVIDGYHSGSSVDVNYRSSNRTTLPNEPNTRDTPITSCVPIDGQMLSAHRPKALCKRQDKQRLVLEVNCGLK